MKQIAICHARYCWQWLVWLLPEPVCRDGTGTMATDGATLARWAMWLTN